MKQRKEISLRETKLSQCVRFPAMWYVRPAKAQTSLRIRTVCLSLCKSLEYSMNVKLLTQRHLDFLSLKKAAQALLSLHLSKCHINGNHM